MLASRFKVLRDAAGGVAWSPLVQASRALCLAVLGKIQVGGLEIVDLDSQVHKCGEAEASGTPSATLTIHKDAFWVRLALFGDMVRLLPC